MQADILRDIDELVEMAESTNDVETSKEELKEIAKESEKLKKELDYYNNIIGEEKYFQASERQVDESIKVSLEAKIAKQEKTIKELKEELASTLESEQTLHTNIANFETQIATSSEYIAILEKRIESSTEETSHSQYQEIVTAEKKNLEQLQADLEKAKNEYDTLTSKINYLNLAKEEMNKKLASEKTKLNDTKASLINPASYIDYDLKKIDNEHVSAIKNKLLKLDKRRIEILTDPTMIAKEAKDLILEDDRTGALAKIKELVTIVKTKPYMDLPSGSELSSFLHDELISASDKRDEFAATLDNKDYTSGNNQILNERIEFLKQEINDLKDQIKDLEDKVHKMDTTEFDSIQKHLENAEKRAEELSQQIVMYEEIMHGDDADKSPRRKAILNASLSKKQEELANVSTIIDNYKKDQKKLIFQTNEILTKEIAALQEKIAVKTEEINALNKMSLNASEVQDVLAIETDKMKLKELDDVVKSIKHREKYTRTPNEIYDEIEIYFGTLDNPMPEEDNEIEPVIDDELFKEPEVQEENPVSNEYPEIPDYEIEVPIEEDAELNFEPATSVNQELPEEPISVDEVMNELPNIDEFETEPVSERKKVINIEPIMNDEVTENPTDTESDFIIGDYKDDDYLDMSSLLENDEVL